MMRFRILNEKNLGGILAFELPLLIAAFFLLPAPGLRMLAMVSLIVFFHIAMPPLINRIREARAKRQL